MQIHIIQFTYAQVYKPDPDLQMHFQTVIATTQDFQKKRGYC